MMLNQPPPELFAERPVRSDQTSGMSYRGRRLVTIAVAALFIGGALYFGFGRSSHPVDPSAIPTIKADASYKERPEQPGGIDIPHQDVDVYKELDSEKDGKEAAEHLLPVAETPQPAPAETSGKPTLEAPPVAAADTVESLFDTTSKASFDNKNAAVVTKEIPTTVTASRVVAEATAPARVEPAPAAPVTQKAEIVNKAAVAEMAKVETPKAEMPKVLAPKVAKKVAAVVAPAATVPVEAVSSVGGKAGPVVQLAASPDEAAAHKMLDEYQSKYAAILNDAHLRIVRADLGSKGIYYRVQTEPVSADQAGRICQSLKNRGAGCFIVR